MNLLIECKKIKRTGLLPVFLIGGILAALFPLLDMTFRSEVYIKRNQPPVETLFSADWQMMAMLNILLVIICACFMYYEEYADNAIQKMCSLPIRESRLYFEKFILMTFLCLLVFVIEGAAFTYCALRWFGKMSDFFPLLAEVIKNFGYCFILILPVELLSLLIASACRNLWTSLGAGVICLCLAAMIPAKNQWLSLFPYALPFQVFAGTKAETAIHFVTAGAVECAAVILAELLFLRVRRAFA